MTLLTRKVVSALPYLENNATELLLSRDEQTLSRRSLSGFQFRIMTLGASIANGYGSTDQNGFRYPIRNQLIQDGAKVNMIGSHQSGNMQDSEVSPPFEFTRNAAAAADTFFLLSPERSMGRCNHQ